MTSDDDLVAATLAGDPRAFDALVGRYTNYVYGVARRFVGPDADADDIVQEAFVRAFTKLHTYDPRGRFKLWLGVIAANYAKDVRRRRQFVTTGADRLPPRLHPLTAGPEIAALAREAEDELAERLVALGPTCSPAIALVYGAGLSYREAEAALGISTTTLKMRLYRGRQKLLGALAGAV